MKKEIENKLQLIGGIVPIRESLMPLDEDELGSLEAKLGIALPSDYREFLKTYGTCAFAEYTDFVPVEPLPHWISDDGKGHFGSFYGGRHDPTRSLAREIEVFRDRMPESVIPIGEDSGNQICLGIKGEERGKVYYWDHENEWDEEDYLEDHGEPMPPEMKFQNLHLIADSFEDFIRRLEISKDA